MRVFGRAVITSGLRLIGLFRFSSAARVTIASIQGIDHFFYTGKFFSRLAVVPSVLALGAVDHSPTLIIDRSNALVLQQGHDGG